MWSARSAHRPSLSRVRIYALASFRASSASQRRAVRFVSWLFECFPSLPGETPVSANSPLPSRYLTTCDTHAAAHGRRNETPRPAFLLEVIYFHSNRRKRIVRSVTIVNGVWFSGGHHRRFGDRPR